MYKITEIYRAIQGEGKYTGWPCLIVRFQGCNLQCPYCDQPESEFLSYTLSGLVETIRGSIKKSKFLLFTGGEPALQVDRELVDALESVGRMHIETNGTCSLPNGINWVTLSPKGPVQASVVMEAGEVKWIVEDRSSIAALLQFLDRWKFRRHVALQPLYGNEEAVEIAYDACLEHGFQLSLQTHKLIRKR